MTEKKSAEEMLAEAKAIAAKLKRADKAAYRDVFAWIGRVTTLQCTPAGVVLESMRALEREFNAGRKPRHLLQYLNGIRRDVMAERKAEEFRQRRIGQAGATVGEVLVGLGIPKSQTEAKQ